MDGKQPFQKVEVISGAAVMDTLSKAEVGMVPYYVSGRLSKKFSYVGVVGTLLHVGCWVSSFFIDVLPVMDKIEMDTHKDSRDFFWFSFAPFLLAFCLVVLTTLGHFIYWATRAEMWKWAYVPYGEGVPAVLAFITSANLASIFFTFLLLTSSADPAEQLRLNTYNSTLYSVEQMTEQGHDWRMFVCVSILMKFYIYAFMTDNKILADGMD